MQLEAKDIGFRYGNGPWLFRGVNLTLEPGEIVGITGPSGRGKTTLCRILAGFEQPIEGTVTFNGATIAKERIPSCSIGFSTSRKSNQSALENA